MADKIDTLTYNDYIKGINKLKPEEQLSLVELILSGLRKTLTRKERKHSITELEGLGADIWKEIDVDDYLRKERNSWD